MLEIGIAERNAVQLLSNKDSKYFNNDWTTAPHTYCYAPYVHGNFTLNSQIGAYDVAEIKVVSLHELSGGRETVRIIGVAAGESLHNIYRVIMTALGQREDRARLVFHAWALPDGRAFGNGPRYKEVLKELGNDREIFLNHLPIFIGYEIFLVFGKCIYSVQLTDIFAGLTDEQDLIWTPRICEGSYGEAVPFDLCYFPYLFTRSLPETPEDSSLVERFQHLQPKYSSDQFLVKEELDEINSILAKMRFIRQNSQIKPLLRKNRPEDYVPSSELRCRLFRMRPRNFFFCLWAHLAQQQLFKSNADSQGSSSNSSNRVDPLWTQNSSSSSEEDFVSPHSNTLPAFTQLSLRRPIYVGGRFPRCRVSRRTITTVEGPIKSSSKDESTIWFQEQEQEQSPLQPSP